VSIQAYPSWPASLPQRKTDSNEQPQSNSVPTARMQVRSEVHTRAWRTF
jgi:hypothetical protein